MSGSPNLASSFAQRVVIGVGDAAVSNNPAITLSTYALGSCVGVIAYDSALRAGGILHMMLPHSSIAPAKAATQPAMFADTGLPLFFNALNGLKVDFPHLRIFVVGGASVLAGTDAFKVGERNVEATLLFLSRNNFAITQSLVGGNINRTVHLTLGTGQLTLKTPGAVDSISLAG